MHTLSISKAKKYLTLSMDSIWNQKDSFLYDPDRAFSRTQKISFYDTMLFPIVLSNQDMDIELMEFFGTKNTPSLSALCYRRQQIKPDAYRALFNAFSSFIPRYRTFHGMHLIACDGTRLNTPYNPSDPESYVKCSEDRKGFNQLHLNTLYDLNNQVYLDAEIQGYHSMNEKQAFCQMIDRYEEHDKSIIIADRGYASFNVIAHLDSNEASFVIRLDKTMAENLFHSTPEIYAQDIIDVQDDIHVCRRRTVANKKLHNYHFVSPKSTYDYIDVRSSDVDVFSVRLLKFPISENTDEYILTNLPATKYPMETIKEIYRLRWGIETSYRHLKYADGMAHIRSLRHDFIIQEIYAKLTGYNFCMSVKRAGRNSSKQTKYNYQIDKTNHIKMCLLYLKGVLTRLPDKIKKVPVRAGRTFERIIRRQHADTLQYK